MEQNDWLAVLLFVTSIGYFVGVLVVVWLVPWSRITRGIKIGFYAGGCVGSLGVCFSLLNQPEGGFFGLDMFTWIFVYIGSQALGIWLFGWNIAREYLRANRSLGPREGHLGWPGEPKVAHDLDGLVGVTEEIHQSTEEIKEAVRTERGRLGEQIEDIHEKVVEEVEGKVEEVVEQVEEKVEEKVDESTEEIKDKISEAEETDGSEGEIKDEDGRR